MDVFLIKVKRSYVYTDKYGSFQKSSKVHGSCIFMDEERAIQLAERFKAVGYIDDYKIVKGTLTIEEQ